jgi:hypothetical protein
MRSLIGSVVAGLVASSLFAQPSFLGEPFPLTHTRYGTSRGHLPVLLSDGTDPVLFWADGRNVRMTRGVNTVSRAVLANDAAEAGFDAVWTGTHFLVVGVTQESFVHRIVGRRVSRNGTLLGEQFTIAEGRNPRLAFNGDDVLLLFVPWGTLDVSAFLLTPNGRPAEAGPRSIGITAHGRIAVASNGNTFAAVIPRDREPRIVVFDRDGHVTSESVLGDYGLSASIASDGSRYLAVAACASAGLCGPVYARMVEPDGTLGAPVTLDPPFPQDPSAVWSGDDWVISYVRETLTTRPTMQLLHLDPEGRTITKRSEVPSGAASSLALVDGDVVAAWVGNDEIFDTIYLDGAPAAVTATRQQLLTAASSNEQTLVVWQEIGNMRTTVHAGVRANDGTWRERELVLTPKPECCYEATFSAIAASNGSEFLLIISGPTGTNARRLDANLVQIGDLIDLTATPVGQVLWNGDDYLLINSGSHAITRLSASGVMSEPVPVPLVGQSAIFATDASGNLYATWIPYELVDHQIVPIGVAGIRLGRNLQPLDPAPVMLAVDRRVDNATVGWDGTRFVVIWTADTAMRAVHVGTDGTRSDVRELPPTNIDRPWLRTARVAGGIAILHGGRLTFLRHDGTSTAPVTMSTDVEPGTIERLPDGDLGYLEAVQLDGVPYEDVSRVTMRVVSVVPLPARPEGPRVSLRQMPKALVLHWSPPAQPVAGYRVEVRVGDEPWIELTPAPTADQWSMTVPVMPEAIFTYRVRAWNEAGMGAYSDVIIANGRRRAVR